MPRCPKCHQTYPGGQFCPKDGTRLLEDREDGTPAGGDPLVGQILADRFRIVSRLGVGGMGTVYEAEHCFIKKRVAIKLLRQEITSNPDALARFQREALAASTIGHENIVAIDDFGRLPDGRVYLTMEYLDGDPLNRVLQGQALSSEQILNVMLQTCHGLAAAHSKGIIHRDMKPENVFLVDEGRRAKILDFGIAKVTRGDTGDTNLTKTGAIFGTPNYMAPEQALGRRVDHRADIYAMGIILYEMLAGLVPFRSDSFLAILTLHVTKEPDPPSAVAEGRDVPQDLERIAMRAIAKDPGLRYQDMGEMVSDLLQARDVLVGDKPLESKLRLSKIMPPASQAPTADDRPAVAPQEGQAANPTATAGELVAPVALPRRRTGLIIGGMTAALLVGAAAVVGYHVYQRGQTDGGTPPRVAAVTAGAVATPTAVDASRPDTKPVRRMVDVMISTIPTAVSVLRDGKPVGRTPTVLEVAAGSSLDLILRRKGFSDRAVRIATAPDQDKLVKEFRLVRKPGRRVRRRRREPPRRPRSDERPRPRPRPVSDHGDHGPETTHGGGEESSHVDGH